MKKFIFWGLLVIVLINSNFASAKELNFDKAGCQGRNYIPPTTDSELVFLRKYGVFMAYLDVAPRAGYRFNLDLFNLEQPNPNPGAFHFGIATGQDCYPIDVMQIAVSEYYFLVKKQVENPQDFKEFFLRRATILGYGNYLVPVEDLNLIEVEEAS